MKRTLYPKLCEWKNSIKRKPLIVKGARQVGKTWLLNEFGKKEFKTVHYCNFQKELGLRHLFSESLNPHTILEQLEFFFDTSIDTGRDLIFFDEIQECDKAITSLKYFSEDMPHLALCCAGSLLGVVHSNSSFPVGKISFLNMFPMSFEEFLLGTKDQRSYDYYQSIRKDKKIPEVIHRHMFERLREYMCVGGLPEVVSEFVQYRENRYTAFERARAKQHELLNSYVGDFSKYSGKIRASEIHALFQSIPSQLARENRKFKASDVIPGGRFSRLRDAIDWLTGAGLLIKVPVANSGKLPFSAFCKENRFKLYLFDTGLLGALADLSPKAIFLPTDLFATFKGAFCENLVAQEFIGAGQKKLFSWASSNIAEVEFIREIEGNAIPIEVKAGISGRIKSANVFAQKYNSPFRIRLNADHLHIHNESGMHNYPLYLAGKCPLNDERSG